MTIPARHTFLLRVNQRRPRTTLAWHACHDNRPPVALRWLGEPPEADGLDAGRRRQSRQECAIASEWWPVAVRPQTRRNTPRRQPWSVPDQPSPWSTSFPGREIVLCGAASFSRRTAHRYIDSPTHPGEGGGREVSVPPILVRERHSSRPGAKKDRCGSWMLAFVRATTDRRKPRARAYG